ncbi:endonuclease/exonuclease/phosphatase family protein [Halobacillus mangrovi]|uniref:endonuclease/exonuclease/phosphatase family protein n=1 Tax=Halobacillus mangrovi TaxID=402384 RepID=UPI003D9831A0
MDLQIMTFNLRVDLPQDGVDSWGYRAEKVARMIKKHNPLVLGVQEVLIHMIKDLERFFPDYSWIGEGRRGGMSDEFCPIFYNHDVLECVDSGQFWLSDQPAVPNSISWDSDFPRICTWGHFRSREKPFESFLVYNTHLDHISQSARENGIALIWERMNSHYREKNIPIVLTGDLNSQPDNSVIEFLRGKVSILGLTTDLQDSYAALTETPGNTFHSFQGGSEGVPIDYIFCTPNGKVLETQIDRNTYDGSYPSDHYPVTSRIEICT